MPRCMRITFDGERGRVDGYVDGHVQVRFYRGPRVQAEDEGWICQARTQFLCSTHYVVGSCKWNAPRIHGDVQICQGRYKESMHPDEESVYLLCTAGGAGSVLRVMLAQDNTVTAAVRCLSRGGQGCAHGRPTPRRLVGGGRRRAAAGGGQRVLAKLPRG